MAEFFKLSTVERLEALNAAASSSGRLLICQKKISGSSGRCDTCLMAPMPVIWSSSLSKAYGVIRRFSEDVDLTYDIRAIAGDLVGDADAPLPASKSQEKKWSKEIRARLAEWVANEIVP